MLTTASARRSYRQIAGLLFTAGWLTVASAEPPGKSPVAQAEGEGETADQSLKKLEGRWGVILRAAGFTEGTKETLPVLQLLMAQGDDLEIKDGKLQARGDKKGSPLAITLDPSKSPKTIDLTDEKEGRTLLGIYELKGDNLEIVVGVGNTRPADFDKKPRPRIIQILLKRV